MLKFFSVLLVFASLVSTSKADEHSKSVVKTLCEHARIYTFEKTVNYFNFIRKEKESELGIYKEISKKMDERNKEICQSGSALGLNGFGLCANLCLEMGTSKLRKKLKDTGLTDASEKSKNCAVYCQAHEKDFHSYRKGLEEGIVQMRLKKTDTSDCNGNVSNSDRTSNKSNLESSIKAGNKATSSQQ